MTKTNENKKVKINKIKQIIHAYLPILILFILPKSWLSLFIAGAYFNIAGYSYFKRADNGENDENFEYFMVNSLVTLAVFAGYVNAL